MAPLPPYISVNCDNATIWYQMKTNISALNLTDPLQAQRDHYFREKDKNALLYIVVVLLFYSTAIIIGIIKYLQQEKAEVEEEKMYEAYVNLKNDTYMFSRYYRMQQIIKRLKEMEENCTTEEKASNCNNLQPLVERSYAGEIELQVLNISGPDADAKIGRSNIFPTSSLQEMELNQNSSNDTDDNSCTGCVSIISSSAPGNLGINIETSGHV